MNKLNIIFGIILIFIFNSCGTGIKIKQSDFNPIDIKSSGTFNINSYKNKGKKTSDTANNINLLRLFNIDSTSYKPKNITIQFDRETDLYLSYQDTWSTETKTFSGKFKKRGYYEIFLLKERIVIPFIYMKKRVHRLRIVMDENGDLIIDSFWNNSGMIFIIGGGRSNRRQYYFKKID